MNGLRAFGLDVLPEVGWYRRNLDLDPVQTRATHHGCNATPFNLQIENRTVPRVGSSSWQSIGIVAVIFEILTPSFAPKSHGHFPRRNMDGTTRLAFGTFVQFSELLCGLGSSLCNGYIRGPTSTPSHDRFRIPLLVGSAFSWQWLC